MTADPIASPIERIGIDESGKGDYFGPLVIAAVFVDATTQRELALMQARDSKKLSDGRILEMAPAIKTICPHSVIAIGPQKYNELYAKIKNLNRLLAWGHARALENLLERVSCKLAIADRFGDERLIVNALQEKGRTIVLEQRTKAESDLAVAAASILARAEFLRRLKQLSAEVGITLPKGVSPSVELAAKMIVKKHGRERLGTVAKLHFRTTRAVLGYIDSLASKSADLDSDVGEGGDSADGSPSQ
ncbi:ribonuclease HIII [Candidatus Nitrospira inopinata]|uniref:Ribonuclease n=1 Tax=Candidatus Nitrospira inopinata TaxID=1715989 RepID=A0A0S4KKY0_9BACT|nr:ribonuclease HIII [Candidatus Nitrospira inopinata]CUQ65084.1 Ribonuclease [Candidatus Nitrospira inopinata]